MTPSLSGFIAFIRNVMGISPEVLPDNAAVIPMAYDVALEIVNEALALASGTIYTLAVYNLAGSNVINYAQDVQNAPAVAGGDPPLPFFAFYRKLWNILNPVFGVVQNANDDGTGDGLLVPDAFKQLTIANLQQLKDPYGRKYLDFAQSYGPSVWGLS